MAAFCRMRILNPCAGYKQGLSLFLRTLNKRNVVISTCNGKGSNGSSTMFRQERRFETDKLYPEVKGLQDINLPLTSTSVENEVLYRFRWIKQVRFVSRVKIIHVAIVSGLTWPMGYWYTTGLVTFPVLISAVFGALGTTAGLVGLSYFFRRVVGEISVNETAQTVTISSLTFWGNRRDRTFPLFSLVPLEDSGIDSKNMFHRLEVQGAPDVFLLSLRHGKIFHESFFRFIGLAVNQDTSKGTALSRGK